MHLLASIFESKKILLITFIGIIVAVPTLAFLYKTRVGFDSSASTEQYTKQVTEASNSAKASPKLTLDDLRLVENPKASPTPAPAVEEPATAEGTFGPTLKVKVQIQGRPKTNQATDLFIGIAAGSIVTASPQYILTFVVPVTSTGDYNNISLAGIDVGQSYIAYLKGPTQIATASAFLMQPNATSLNNGQVIPLITGDLNQDNVINNLDLSLAKANLGRVKGNSDFNPSMDFNLDGVINLFDIAIIISNIGKQGIGNEFKTLTASGSANLKLDPLIFSSTPPNTTSSTDASPSGGTPGGGYWMWVPKY